LRQKGMVERKTGYLPQAILRARVDNQVRNFDCFSEVRINCF